MTKARRFPRRHRVREHGRGKPTGGKTDVDSYDRGRGGRSATSPSAGGRAQTRMTFWEARRARAKAARLARAKMKKAGRRESIEELKRRAQATLDLLREEESDAFADEKAADDAETL